MKLAAGDRLYVLYEVFHLARNVHLSTVDMMIGQHK
jgi:hypothetical protein